MAQGYNLRLTKRKKQNDVTISDIALDDLREYLQQRNKIYGFDDSEKAVFLSSPTGPGGTVNRLRRRSATSMLVRYVAAYGKPLTMHKLRHTYATNDYIKNNDLAGLMEQLGHDINTTLTYTHISNDKRRKSVNKADS